WVRRPRRIAADNAAGVFHVAVRPAYAVDARRNLQKPAERRPGYRWPRVPLFAAQPYNRARGRRGHLQYVLVLAGGGADPSGPDHPGKAGSGEASVRANAGLRQSFGALLGTDRAAG